MQVALSSGGLPCQSFVDEISHLDEDLLRVTLQREIVMLDWP